MAFWYASSSFTRFGIDCMISPTCSRLLNELPHLTEERIRAQEVKKDTRVFVCFGNPPYDQEEHDPLDEIGQRLIFCSIYSSSAASTKMLGLKRRQRVPAGTTVELWLGISSDESIRMKTSRDRWIEMIQARVNATSLVGVPWTDVSDETKVSCDQPPLDAPTDEFSVQGRAN